MNGRCPACRRLYSDQIVEFVPVSAEEIVRLKKEKKEKDRQTRDMRDPSRRQLSNVRVVQKNLVYVLGLSLKHASVDVSLLYFDFALSQPTNISLRTNFSKSMDASKKLSSVNVLRPHQVLIRLLAFTLHLLERRMLVKLLRV